MGDARKDVETTAAGNTAQPKSFQPPDVERPDINSREQTLSSVDPALLIPVEPRRAAEESSIRIGMPCIELLEAEPAGAGASDEATTQRSLLMTCVTRQHDECPREIT